MSDVSQEVKQSNATAQTPLRLQQLSLLRLGRVVKGVWETPVTGKHVILVRECVGVDIMTTNYRPRANKKPQTYQKLSEN